MKAALLTLMISMVPVLELRAGIPFGVAGGLSIRTAVLFAILGNILPIPFLVIFTKKVFSWLRTKSDRLNAMVLRLEAKAEKNKAIVLRYEFLGLMILVAIPLPGTGGWTGALVAAMMDMPLKKSLPAIFMGIVIAAVIVATMTYGVKVFV